jgi:hypothetical protein
MRRTNKKVEKELIAGVPAKSISFGRNTPYSRFGWSGGADFIRENADKFIIDGRNERQTQKIVRQEVHKYDRKSGVQNTFWMHSDELLSPSSKAMVFYFHQTWKYFLREVNDHLRTFRVSRW